MDSATYRKASIAGLRDGGEFSDVDNLGVKGE